MFHMLCKEHHASEFVALKFPTALLEGPTVLTWWFLRCMSCACQTAISSFVGSMSSMLERLEA